jgi:HAD domain in Swiss Army Knife RNA repair proteins
MHSPILLIDIDGVISLFGFDPAAPPGGKFLLVDGIPHFLSAAAAGRLRRLQADFELVWCSGWEEKADEYLPHALGLPAGLPHLTFDAADGDDRHWKLAAIDRYAGPHRPLAWIDDAFDDSCHRWAADRPGPTELVLTDPAVGLTASQTERLRRWARSLERAVPPGAGPEPLKP